MCDVQHTTLQSFQQIKVTWRSKIYIIYYVYIQRSTADMIYQFEPIDPIFGRD